MGHADGVITIDLAESLELYRERQRIILKEPYRTMLGHLRHEVGHYYEMILITGGELIDQTRAFFGDERRDYQAALADYYAGASRTSGNTTTSRTTPPPTPGRTGRRRSPTICTSPAPWRPSPTRD